MGSSAILPRSKQDVGSSTDRRGINAQGQFSNHQQSFSVFTRRKFMSLFCSRSNDVDTEASEILSSTWYTPHDIKGGYQHNQPLTTVNGEKLWQLDPNSDVKKSWNQLEKTIDAFIAVTPVDEYQFTPRIVVEACEMGRDRSKTQPTVLISCSSKPYGKKMARTLQQSGALETHSATFRVVVRP